MKVITSVEEMKKLRTNGDLDTGTVGFVPTMGALHQGHLSLVRQSELENDKTVVSIFVNPTQFNDPKDLEKYPRPVEEDKSMLAQVGVDYLFYPDSESLYGDGYRFRVFESDFSKVLCGAHRPGHFDGVLSIVMKLFNIVKPTRAYFGEKDYQQLELIRGMVNAFFMNVEIRACPTVREADGLAMSSRNRRLSPEQRALAPMLARVLEEASTAIAAHRALGQLGFKVDYVEELVGRRFAAAFLGDVRLIDNVEL